MEVLLCKTVVIYLTTRQVMKYSMRKAGLLLLSQACFLRENKHGGRHITAQRAPNAVCTTCWPQQELKLRIFCIEILRWWRWSILFMHLAPTAGKLTNYWPSPEKPMGLV